MTASSQTQAQGSKDSTDESSLRLCSLSVTYGPIRAVKDVNICVRKRGRVAVIGPNGAGKTTLVHAIAGLVTGVEGEVRFRDRDIGKLSAEHRSRMGLTVVPEGRGLIPRLTVDENLLLGGYSGPTREARISADQAYDLFPLLKDLRKQRAGTLSGGQLQILAIARALCSKPEVIVLDEPSMGLAPIVLSEVRQALQAVGEGNSSILLMEQNANLAFDLADYIYVLELGQIVLEGASDEMRENEGVRSAYLGL